MTFEGHFSTGVTLCAQLSRDLLAIDKFLLLLIYGPHTRRIIRLVQKLKLTLCRLFMLQWCCKISDFVKCRVRVRFRVSYFIILFYFFAIVSQEKKAFLLWSCATERRKLHGERNNARYYTSSQRRRGRPRTRWQDNITKWTGLVAGDRLLRSVDDRSQ